LGAEVEEVPAIGVLAASAPSVSALASGLAGDPRVAYVERDRTLRAAGAFDGVDPASGIPFTWAFDAVRAGEALAAAGGGSRRQVAVIDTGVDAGHPDLAGRIGRSLDTASGGASVTDLSGHGTFIAGLISSVDGNGVGGRGVAGNTQIFPVRASVDGVFTVADVLRGLEFAVRAKADIVNLSLAGGALSRSHARALDDAFLNDVLPVAASGNRALEGNPVEFPAAAVGGYRGGDGIGLSVAATLPDGRPARFSNHNDYVSLAAPGGDQDGCAEGVFSTIPRNSFATLWDDPTSCSRVFAEGGGRFAYGEGTSFSAPVAAGMAALVWQVERKLASEQVADVMVRSARQTLRGGRWNEFTGAGVIDGKAATDLARVYDVRAPLPRGRARRLGRAKVRATVARTRDRTNAGRELAGKLSYALLVSADGGRNYTFAVRPRRRPIRATATLRGRRKTLFLASVCDGNGNCASKKLGSFRRR
jgi:subtilisin family serine protease